MSLRIARMMMLCAAFVAVIAAPSAAQVSTGRIDASIVDSTGAVLPGVIVEINGPQKQAATTDSSGEAHFLNLPPGTYSVSAKLSGFGDYLNKNVPVATGASVPLQDRDVGRAACPRRSRSRARSPVVDTKKMSDLDERQRRRAAEHPLVARPVGRAADRARRHRRPRQRRRRRIGSAVELPGEGRVRR